jgi:hypothetical protein
MRNEVRSQRLMSFLQVVGGNQNLAPFAKFPYLIREIASAMDLDADKVTNNPDEAQRQALLLQQMGGQATPQGTPGAPPGANPMDPTGAGGGNIGVGTAPAPGMPGFSGAPPAAPPAPGGMNG